MKKEGGRIDPVIAAALEYFEENPRPLIDSKLNDLRIVPVLFYHPSHRYFVFNFSFAVLVSMSMSSRGHDEF